MKATFAVLATLAIFLLMWFVIAGLILTLMYFSGKAGLGGGLFIGLNALLAWILSPFAGAAVAVYASISTFKTVDPKTIFVAFVSICASLIAIIFFIALATSSQGGAGNVLLFLCQAAAIFIGARVGKFFANDVAQ